MVQCPRCIGTEAYQQRLGCAQQEHHRCYPSPMKPLRGTILVFLVLVIISWFEVPSIVESRNNKLLVPPPYHSSAAAQGLHKTLIVADLHADSLLWDRNLLKRSTRGHVDL